ncbi:hypothetical protein G6F70_002008 [Rhizopus microsporus]|uniref:Uncharacterized protein n=2 Tax=Rhizopus TaxID=4842 RepID=A0A367JSE7_RHIAZ|nr:hypothetical protein G6F71_000504 [Rhizopus microsporus]RCH92848.1 hypothetical protein CU097_002534 [Rhizopus azygosporus]KAG1202746.1 hypothetical protein G6F70_002008 [Rhizopus microsporus]KAG1215568.1 hypothetical protein G6F69_000925 [Rhizopus microsporus]KAG1238822.1 hypothetical protein G6F67_000171 [Rhizopus microsporus]
MRALLLFSGLISGSLALITDTGEECIVVTPIGNTVVKAGEKMKIQWSHSHIEAFENIYLTLTDGVQNPVIIASNVRTDQRKITVDLPRTLIPSNAYRLTLGEPPHHCTVGKLRVVAAAPVMGDPYNPANTTTTPGVYPKEEDGARQLTNHNAILLTGLLSIVYIVLQFHFI